MCAVLLQIVVTLAHLGSARESVSRAMWAVAFVWPLVALAISEHIKSYDRVSHERYMKVGMLTLGSSLNHLTSHHSLSFSFSIAVLTV